MNKIPTHRVTVEEMRQRVALKSDQNGFDGGLPDSRYPSATRTLINIIGFQPPEGDPTLVSPVGAQAAENAAIKINEGFNLGFCDALPGHGPVQRPAQYLRRNDYANYSSRQGREPWQPR